MEAASSGECFAAVVRTPMRRWQSAAGAVLAASALFLFAGSILLSNDRLFCSPRKFFAAGGEAYSPAVAELADAAVHYAETKITPQQSFAEISVALAVLRRRAPCNFLVFGLGRDSRLWSALNPGGFTLFLEDDEKWFRIVKAEVPHLRAALVSYSTRLSDADEQVVSYRSEKACLPAPGLTLKNNRRCKLALSALPDAVYSTEWDVIMIDAPKGYYPAAPGRIAPIYSAAAMAWARKGDGDTDVFLHDIDRPAERKLGEEFLCGRFRVGGAGRLWHFKIPPAARRDNGTCAHDSSHPFCCSFQEQQE